MQEFVTYQEATFEAYCKTLIRNEGKNARKAIVRRARHEVNHSMYDDTPQPTHAAVEDTYDVSGMTFVVRGLAVKVSDPVLGQALAALSPYRREVILRFYFLEQNEPSIATLLHRDTSTVNYQRSRALKHLRMELEEMGYGK